MSASPHPPASSGKWRTLLLLALAELLVLGLWFSASAVSPTLAVLWNLTTAQQAWLTMAVQLGFVAGALGIAVTNVADRLDSSRLFFSGASLGTAATLALLLPGVGLGEAVLLRCMTGASLAAVYPVGMRIMTTWTRHDRGTGLGLLVGALTIGSATPHLLRALGGTTQWRGTLVLAGALAMAGGLCVLAGVREGPYATARPRLDLSQFLAVLRVRPLRLASLGYFGHMWELYAMWTWLPAFLTAAYSAAHPAAAAEAAQRFAAYGTFAAIAAGGPGSLLWGRLGDRYGRTAATILSLAISGSCAATIGLAFGGSTALVVAITLVWGATVVADSAQFSTAVSELGDPARTGTALAAQLAFGFLLTLVSIQLTPLVAGAIGWRWTFLCLVPGPLVGMAAMVRLRRLPEASRMAGGRR